LTNAVATGSPQDESVRCADLWPVRGARFHARQTAHGAVATAANIFIELRLKEEFEPAALSNQFRQILVETGLVEPRRSEATGKGRSGRREPSEISFHSLRHSAVTMLKAAGVSDFIAREIVGHESAAVSRQYTHLTTDDKRAAMQRLPDVTSGF
jgi:site-specific recombinase XerC